MFSDVKCTTFNVTFTFVAIYEANSDTKAVCSPHIETVRKNTLSHVREHLVSSFTIF